MVMPPPLFMGCNLICFRGQFFHFLSNRLVCIDVVACDLMHGVATLIDQCYLKHNRCLENCNCYSSFQNSYFSKDF